MKEIKIIGVIDYFFELLNCLIHKYAYYDYSVCIQLRMFIGLFMKSHTIMAYGEFIWGGGFFIYYLDGE